MFFRKRNGKVVFSNSEKKFNLNGFDVKFYFHNLRKKEERLINKKWQSYIIWIDTEYQVEITVKSK